MTIRKTVATRIAAITMVMVLVCTLLPLMQQDGRAYAGSWNGFGYYIEDSNGEYGAGAYITDYYTGSYGTNVVVPATLGGQPVVSIKLTTWKEITSLNTTACTALKYLSCSHNELTTLDVTYNTALEYLDCSYDNLTALDVTYNTALIKLYCVGNSLTALDVTNNIALTELECGSNKLTTLDVSKNVLLGLLRCNRNNLSELDISENILLFAVHCDENNLTTIDISNNTALYWLGCAKNNITDEALLQSLIERFGEGNVLPQKYKENGFTYTIQNGEYGEGAYINDYDTAGIYGTNPVIPARFNAKPVVYINLNDSHITSIDVTGCTGLKFLACENNNLASLDVSENVVLTHLWCGSNNLTELDVSKNISLIQLGCSNNNFSTLDVSENTGLTGLSCYNNNLISLDISKSTALTELYCEENSLAVLDVSENTALRILYCQENNLTTLDVSKNTELSVLNCQENNLTALDVTRNDGITFLFCRYNNISDSTLLQYLISRFGTNQVLPQNISEAFVANIVVKTQPKLFYAEGDTLDLSALIATLTYSDGASEDVSFGNFAAKGITTSVAHGAELTTAHQGVNISLSKGNLTAQTSALTVVAKPITNKSVTNIAVKTQPKLTYTEGDTLDLGSLVATLTYSDGTSEDVLFANFAAKGITTSIAHGTKLTMAHHGAKISLTSGSLSAQTSALTVTAAAKPPLGESEKATIIGAVVTAIPDTSWSGAQIKPVLTVTLGGKALKLGTDYTVTYGANKDIGKGTATITGKGAYKDTKAVAFNIIPTKLSISKLTVGKKQVKVAWKAAPKAQGITKIQIRYALKGKTKWKTVNVPAKSLNTTIKKLKTKKTYQFQIRSYKTVSGANYYAPWSASKVSKKVK